MYLSARSTCAALCAQFHDSVLLFQNNPSPYSPTNTGNVASIVFFLTWQMDFATSFRCLGMSIGSMNSGRAARMDQSDHNPLRPGKGRCHGLARFGGHDATTCSIHQPPGTSILCLWTVVLRHSGPELQALTKGLWRLLLDMRNIFPIDSVHCRSKGDSVEAAYRDHCVLGMLPGIVLLSANREGKSILNFQRSVNNRHESSPFRNHIRLPNGNAMSIHEV